MISALTNETDKEHEVSKQKISNFDELTDILAEILLLNLYALLIVFVLICICK